MKLAYHSETDSVYIDLAEQPSVESREISAGIVLDYGVAGNLVGIDIDNASRKVQLQRWSSAGSRSMSTVARANVASHLTAGSPEVAAPVETAIESFGCAPAGAAA